MSLFLSSTGHHSSEAGISREIPNILEDEVVETGKRIIQRCTGDSEENFG
jgi:hypothetical protein